MRLYLAMSYEGGWGGVVKTAESIVTHIHLAEHDPQHHGLPIRGVQQATQSHPEPLRLRILLSYHYYKDTDLDALFSKYFTPPYPEVFLDSGGFSAATQGATIDLDAYAAYIQRFQHLITTYANLDVIGDANATRRNQERMERKGLAPLPVFHVGEDFTRLADYIQHYPYIALGGMVPHMRDAKRKLMPWLVKAFKLAREDNGRGAVRAVYHGFGCTSWNVVCALPWYSVDSSSWGMGFRFGQVPVFDSRAGRFHEIKLGDHATCYQYAPLVRALGFDPADFAIRARNDRAKVCAISALSYLMAEQWLRKRHGAIHIPTRVGAPVGLRAHLADANPARFGEAQSGMPVGGPLAYLADTSNGINYRDAHAGIKHYSCSGNDGDGRAPYDVMRAQRELAGLKTYLADARGHSASDLAGAEAGMKLHLANDQMGMTSHRRPADGLQVYLAEHSLDRGGVGDTSRALDILHATPQE